MTIELKQVKLLRANQEFYFDLTIPQGQKVAIIGESGAGKSTLLNLLAGFEPISSGKLLWQGEDITKLLPGKRDCAVVFQENNHFPHLSLYDNIALAFLNTKSNKEEQKEKIESMLKKLNIHEIAHKLPMDCSGGQLQRAALARGFLFPRSLLLLDEPLSALDPENAQNVVSNLQQLTQTILLVTHDLKTVLPAVDRVLRIQNGRIVEDYLTSKIRELVYL